MKIKTEKPMISVDLSYKEAMVIISILGMIGGDREGPRKVVEDLYVNILEAYGLTSDKAILIGRSLRSSKDNNYNSIYLANEYPENLK